MWSVPKDSNGWREEEHVAGVFTRVIIPRSLAGPYYLFLVLLHSLIRYLSGPVSSPSVRLSARRGL